MNNKQSRNSLLKLAATYKDHGSRDTMTAFRDIAVDIMRECKEKGYSFNGILEAATNVFWEEEKEQFKREQKCQKDS